MRECIAYIASGWFNEKQVEDLDIIKRALRENEILFFSPKDECPCPPDATEEQKHKSFTMNVNAIVECDFMVCNTRDKDMGSVFESGVAYKCNKPVIFFCRGLKGDFNLMLAKAGVAVATDAEELLWFLNDIKKDPNWSHPYVGRIE